MAKAPAKDAEVEQLAATPTPATGTGTSTGTTALTVASVTGTIVLGSTITGAGVPTGTTVVRQTSGTKGGAGVYVTSVNTTLTAIALTFTVGSTISYFPEFTPIVPPPVIGAGGGAAPTFPPPTPPPIGAVPPGVLVGPAVAAAGTPPSTAGLPYIFYKTGSATVPPANGYFTKFTTTFPNPPVSVQTTPPPPTMITTTPPIGLPSVMTIGGLHAQSVHNGDTAISERRAGSVFSPTDTDQLHQPEPPPGSGSKRMPSRRT